jgi:hypothetical protein
MGRSVGRKLIGLPQQSFSNGLAGGDSRVNAMDNFVVNQSNPHTQTQSNVSANGVPLMAVALNLKFSGTVRVDCDINFGDNTTAKSIEHSLIAIPFTAPIATRFVGAGSGTIETNNSSTGRDVLQNGGLTHLSDWLASMNSDAAGLPANSMHFNGVVPNLASGVSGTFQFWDKTVETLTGQLNNSGQFTMSFHGIVPNFNNVSPNEQFSAAGNVTLVIALLLISTAGGDVVTYGPCNLQISENPTP